MQAVNLNEESGADRLGPEQHATIGTDPYLLA